MPWKIKREFYFILLGVAALVAGIVVTVRDSSTDVRLLGIVAVVGGFAMILNALPTDDD